MTDTKHSSTTGSIPALDVATGSVFDLKCCPHCGGTTGFHYRVTLTGDQFQPWAGGKLDPHFEEDSRLTKHTAKRCDDCGKIIRPNVAGQPRDTTP